MKTSETIAATFGQALSAAQAEFQPIEKDKENPHFKSRYSSLDAIISAVRPALHNHGLLVYHEVSVIEYKLTVVAVLELAVTGERRTNASVIDVTPNVQQIGSAITYLRRYTLAPLLGVCSDEDDDGNAQATAPAKPRQQQSKQEHLPPVTRKKPSEPATPPTSLPNPVDPYIISATKDIEACQSLDEIQAIGEILREKPDAIRTPVIGLYRTRFLHLVREAVTDAETLEEIARVEAMLATKPAAMQQEVAEFVAAKRKLLETVEV